MMRSPAYGIGAGVLILVLAMQCPAVRADTPAPKFDLVTLGGEEYNNTALTGRPALLIFWAPWCRVCQRELPLMADFYNNGKPAQLRVISVGFADRRRNVEEFVHARPATFPFPTAYDIDNDVSQAFKVTATPTYILLNAQGRIVLVHRGAGILQNARFRELLSTAKG